MSVSSGENSPYRPKPAPRSEKPDKVRLLDANEVSFWERCVIAIETSPIPESAADIAERADMFVFLRRERLPRSNISIGHVAGDTG